MIHWHHFLPKKNPMLYFLFIVNLRLFLPAFKEVSTSKCHFTFFFSSAVAQKRFVFLARLIGIDIFAFVCFSSSFSLQHFILFFIEEHRSGQSWTHFYVSFFINTTRKTNRHLIMKSMQQIIEMWLFPLLVYLWYVHFDMKT